MSEPGANHIPAVLHLGDDPTAGLVTALWAHAAALSTMREALSAPIEQVLAAHPERTAVLEQVGLAEQGPDGPVPHPSLRLPDRSAATARLEARLSALRQAVAVAAGAQPAGWAEQDNAVLLHQGRASAGTGCALAEKLVPALPGLAERLDAPGARVLDVGTGVAALAIALARALPRVEVLGIDIAERPLVLARQEIAAAPDASSQVTVRQQNVADIAERDAFDLIWLPAPFLSEKVLAEALPRVTAALAENGWIVIGTNPVSADPLTAAVDRWSAVRGGGSAYNAPRATADLAAAGLTDVCSFPTVPGGPVLVAARRTTRQASAYEA